MKHDLRDAMKSISELTEELIKIVKGDNYSNLESTLNKRQQTIDFLQSLGCSKEEYKILNNEFQLDNLHEKLYNEMDKKKNELREKLYDLSKNKSAANSYNHNSFTGAKIFSKKI